jgi:hypothetical protein
MFYRLTTPKAINTRSTRIEIRVRIPQITVTLLLRTTIPPSQNVTPSNLTPEHSWQQPGPSLEGYPRSNRGAPVPVQLTRL